MLEQTAGDCEPEAGTFAHTFGRGAGLTEAFENRRVVLGGDSDPGVADQDADGFAFHQRFDPDPSARGRKLDPVAEQVIQNFLETQTVGLKHQLGIELAVESDSLGRSEGPHAGQHLGDGHCHREAFEP